MFDGTHLIERINARGALIKVLDKQHLSAMAEDERQRILKQTHEGQAAAHKRGAKLGRKPKLTDHQQAEALKRLAAGESCWAIGETMGLHHATIASLAA